MALKTKQFAKTIVLYHFPISLLENGKHFVLRVNETTLRCLVLNQKSKNPSVSSIKKICVDDIEVKDVIIQFVVVKVTKDLF